MKAVRGGRGSSLLRQAAVLASILIAGGWLGCDGVKKRFAEATGSNDAIVGTWRQVGDETGSTVTFTRKGSYRRTLGKLDPALGDDFIATMRAIGSVPGKYSRGADLIVVSFDVKAFRQATANLPKHGPDNLKGDTIDEVYKYKLAGDILELTTEGKTTTYVRVK